MPPETLACSVVILTWNSSAHLPRCLACLSAQTHRDFEVIIVDNGSTDHTLAGIQTPRGDMNLRIERLASNFGYAVGNNVGARLAQGRWLALLNADAFPEPDWLEQLMQAARAHPEAFFASRQIQADRPDLLDGEGDAYHVSGLAWRRDYGLPVGPPGAPYEVFTACGAAALYPRQAFLDAGGFDEDYFAYHEDVDLGFRLRLRGMRCLFIPQAVVQHVGSAASGKNSAFAIYHGHRNLVWTYFKNMPATLFWLFLPIHVVMTLICLLWFSLVGQGGAIWRAKIDAVRGLPKILPARRQVLQGRRATAFDLYRHMDKGVLAPIEAFVARRRKNGSAKSKP